MLRRVKKYIRDNGLLAEGARVLVCVSGGADSVALLDVLMRSGYQCIAAHCHFGLRGAESDRDEAFVRQLVSDRAAAMQIEVPYYSKHFETLLYAREHALGIEMTARELRYRWFAELAAETGCEAIAVGHHQNDQAETVLMHIRRGCGLKGLCGMWPISKNPCINNSVPVIRPLLCTTHDYICHYLQDIRHIPWIEDSTNSDTSIRRNAIRAWLKTWSKAEIEHAAQMAERMQQLQQQIDNTTCGTSE